MDSTASAQALPSSPWPAANFFSTGNARGSPNRPRQVATAVLSCSQRLRAKICRLASSLVSGGTAWRSPIMATAARASILRDADHGVEGAHEDAARQALDERLQGALLLRRG